MNKRTGRVAWLTALTLSGYFIGALVGAFVSDDPHHVAGGYIGAGLGAVAASAIPVSGKRVLYLGSGC